MALDQLLLLRPDRVNDLLNGLNINLPRLGDSLVLLDEIRHQRRYSLRID
ncbi:MAG TPA: hypothetical protein VN522_08575 [Solirubrobacterales bacterium]|nr:hypothetical protein [Solirubrobacterales bacterium]